MIIPHNIRVSDSYSNEGGVTVATAEFPRSGEFKI